MQSTRRCPGPHSRGLGVAVVGDYLPPGPPSVLPSAPVSDNERVKTSNLPAPPKEEIPSEAIRRGPLSFDPSPPQEEGESVHLTATNNQAELMQWHYRLGHLTFPKLKQLALNGEIPKKLVKVMPPKCTGCIFGAMTKIPWSGKETMASHEVFTATKPGECVHRNQAGGVRLRRPNGINGSWVLCADERETYQEALQVCHDLRRPLQPPALRPPPSRQFIQRDHSSQTRL
jgi:hypothetical protein